jgi:hypothetical protein
MALDFQQVREQIRQLGEDALQRQQRLSDLRAHARELLEQNANQLEKLRHKIDIVVRNHDPSLRCALPAQEALNAHLPSTPLPGLLTVLAADGSQIFRDRHAEVQYGLINVGAIQMRQGTSDPPVTNVYSRLFYDEQVYSLTEATLALRRDLNERTLLAELASQAPAPVITFTDGPMELWGAKTESSEEAAEYQKSLDDYLQVLTQLRDLQVTTAGYVDKPGANLVVRLLEVAMTAEPDLPQIRKLHPLRGVIDADLYKGLLQPGERSALFAIQSQSARNYKGALALHFFYFNAGRAGHPWLARVEIPAWVAESPEMLNGLHSVLVNQCLMMGARPYPYLLHRAHETAVVSQQEQEQVTQMIVLELHRRGIPVEGTSYKQAAKDLPGRTRYEP